MALDIPPPKRDLPRFGPRRADKAPLWRLASWGTAAVLALTALAITSFSDIGTERMRLAFNGEPRPLPLPPKIPAPPPKPPEKNPEVRALEARVATLTADRDRMADRIASLERQIEDVTGSIERQAAKVPPPIPAPESAPEPAPSATPSAAPAPNPPAVSAPEITSNSVSADKAAPASKRLASIAPALPAIIDPLAMPALGTTGVWPNRSAAQLPEPNPEPEPAATAAETETKAVPLPPARDIAAMPTIESVVPARARAPTLPAAYGIELATSANVDALRARWTAIKANHGPLLIGLQPIAVRGTRAGSTYYRLIAGPMPNYAAARQFCARFTGKDVTCHPARFESNAVVQR